MNIKPSKASPLKKYLALIPYVVLASLATILVSVAANPNADAAPVTGFNAGKIIDDGIFVNSGSMNPTQIQSFLNSKVPVCDTNGVQPHNYQQTTFVCLKDYTEGGKSSAQIIYDAAQEFQINPQVLIVLLQKEQALITDTWPLDGQYRTATGYGCPDTAACDSQYYGLTNQIRWAARMFRSILNNNPDWYTPYVLGNNYVRWNPESSCGGSTINIQNRSTQALYNYTPYQPNQAALSAGYGLGDSCSAYGNRNFYLYFTDWFGSTIFPKVFRAESESTVYIMAGGYKIAIPSMSLLQDYGYDPNAIAVVNTSAVNAILTPPLSSGISSALGYVVKSPSDQDADGGTVYFVSVGKKYPIGSMDQFNGFGLDVGAITYLPLDYLQSVGTGALLTNFIRTPEGTIFKVESGVKNIIFSAQTYNSINPSNTYTQFSGGGASFVTSGNPYIDGRAVFIKRDSSDSVYLYNNGRYYAVPSLNIYNCWGVNTLADRPLRALPASYLPAFTPSGPLGCAYNNSGTTNLLNKKSRIAIPSEYGAIAAGSLSADFITIFNSTPASPSPLKRGVRISTSAAVWYIENGTRTVVPSMENFNLLGLATQLDTLEVASLQSIPIRQGVKLGTGKVVKSNTKATVYTIFNNNRYAISSGDDFTAYGYAWSSIETYDDSLLDADYPVTASGLSAYMYHVVRDSVYLLDRNSCYLIPTQQTATYGKSNLKATQEYSSSIAPYVNFSSCKNASEYIKSDSSGTVYKLEDGTKRAVSSWAALLSLNGGSAPTITTLSNANTVAFPSGVGY